MLDLFCGAGGAAMGYHRAGFTVIGVDIEPQPHYPFRFVQDEAISFCRKHGFLFDFIHGSPPCQVHSSLQPFASDHHVNLIPSTRAAMRSTGKPYVIENVVGAPLIDPIMLCGSAFDDLYVLRHRLFESSQPLRGVQCDHEGQAQRSPGFRTFRRSDGEYRKPRSPVLTIHGLGSQGEPVAVMRKVMGVHWMTQKELVQAIPPAYTEYLGNQVVELLSQ